MKPDLNAKGGSTVATVAVHFHLANKAFSLSTEEPETFIFLFLIQSE